MLLRPGKTTCMLFASPYGIKYSDELHLTVNNSVLENKENQNILGA